MRAFSGPFRISIAQDGPDIHHLRYFRYKREAIVQFFRIYLLRGRLKQAVPLANRVFSPVYPCRETAHLRKNYNDPCLFTATEKSFFYRIQKSNL